MSSKPTLSLTYQMRPPQAAAPSEQPPLLLLLHGVGSNEADLFSLAPAVDPRFLVLSVRAPLTLGPGSYAWFHVVFTSEGPNHDPEEAEASRVLIGQFIDEAVEAFGADARRVYLMGFSQGAIMSEAVALTQPERIAGAVLMSGRTLPEVAAHPATPEALAGLPIFVQHGTQDSVLPIRHGRETRDVLEKLPVALTYREYPIPHTITPESFAEANGWLTERLDLPR